MTTLETLVCNMVEDHSSWEIEALISELQMIAERKYSEEESVILSRELYTPFGTSYDPVKELSRLSIYA